MQGISSRRAACYKRAQFYLRLSYTRIPQYLGRPSPIYVWSYLEDYLCKHLLRSVISEHWQMEDIMYHVRCLSFSPRQHEHMSRYLGEVLPPGSCRALRPVDPSGGAREHAQTPSTSSVSCRILSARLHCSPTFWNNASIVLQCERTPVRLYGLFVRQMLTIICKQKPP